MSCSWSRFGLLLQIRSEGILASHIFFSEPHFGTWPGLSAWFSFFLPALLNKKMRENPKDWKSLSQTYCRLSMRWALLPTFSRFSSQACARTVQRAQLTRFGRFWPASWPGPPFLFSISLTLSKCELPQIWPLCPTFWCAQIHCWWLIHISGMPI